MKRCSILVIGLGYFGQAIVRELVKMGHEVTVIEKNQTLVEEFRDFVEDLRCADATDEHVLGNLGVHHYDACVVATGTDLGSSVLITANLKELGARFIAAKAVTEKQAQILKKIGADLIVFPEKEAGERLAHQLLSPGHISAYLGLDPNWSLEELEAPKWMQNKKLKDLDLRRKYGVTVIAIKRNGTMLPNPGGDDEIRPKDHLLIFGRNEDLERIISI
ncbi:MAG: TrkA family potassium uptake protein [Armatimonadetes bacterium]|nr:TrkA family potassium uptake protein [Armatimonadota bacterium]MDW8026950.1 TrkA family potassium uptake protein [Armatimonadota bacterium]